MATDQMGAARATGQDEDALEVLVNQFADPMSFVRELVQNAIDAGSVEIDVSCEWKPAAEDAGAAVIHIDDYGHGMDRTIIETKLTRLFSSDKEGDLTKIGKFGIGFVSVFAVQPDAVCLDTGRGGENWRVLFRRDRSFSLIRLPEPVEGTKIQVIKRMRASEYQALAQRVRRALHFHCKHVDVALRFDGEPITEAFDLPQALIQVRETTDLAEIVIGIMPSDVPAIAGFYNRGLTLLESASEVAGIAFKIQSSYLEHTLSRDNIVQDENYARIMAQREALLRGPLMKALMDKLSALLSSGAEAEQVLPYQSALATLVSKGCTAPAGAEGCVVARSVQGGLVTLRALSAVATVGRLVYASQATPLAEGLAADGGVVLCDFQAPLVEAVYRSLAVRSLKDASSDAEYPREVFALEERFVRPLPFHTNDQRLRARLDALRSAALKLLRVGGEKTAGVAIEQLDYEGSSVRGQLSIVVPGAALATSPLARGGPGLDGTLVVDAGHAQLQPLLPLCDREPELAAYALLKLVLLGKMTAERDSALLAGAMEARWQRTKS